MGSAGVTGSSSYRLGIGAAAACAAWAVAGAARADEPIFGYVNTTDLLPRGKAQAEQQVALRGGQAGGRYRRLEGRTEFDYGLRDDLQLTLYLNYSHVDADRNGVRGLTEGLGIRPGHPPEEPYSRGRFDGATGEAIWRVASPYLSPVGFALLAEATAGPEERAARLRAIVQKNLHDDTIVLAANVWVEAERRPASTPAPSHRPKATTVEFDLGGSYRFRPAWSAAVEYRRRTEFDDIGFSNAAYTADFIGPTLHYGGQRWFFTLTAMRQVGARAHSAALRAQMADGLVFGGRHTRWDGVRLRVGRTF